MLVLTYYGKDQKLKCCWRNCDVIDLDMLALDHIDDNGSKDRRENGNNIYGRLIKQKFPKGFQTLCHNHQWKKQIARLKKFGRKYQK